MEGVSEAHLVGMMAGLAMSGKIPYMNTIASFITRRPFEQILLDAGLHEARIRLVGSGGGVVYAPLGPTHLAMDDIAILRTIPGMTIVAPSDAEEMKRLMPQTVDWPGPLYIRLAKGGDAVVSRPEKEFKIGKAIDLKNGKDALLVSTGITTQIALKAAEMLAADGADAGVLHFHTLKPFDAEALVRAAKGVRSVVAVEEHTIVGGLGSATAEVLAEAAWDRSARFKRIGFPDVFPHTYGSQADLMARYGITAEGVVAAVREHLGIKDAGRK
ncbi:MAG: transketolase, partial [Candidatus Omnitrophica bacterium]|nr:transketolase [Candidatus Omnitrophota bacterium]